MDSSFSKLDFFKICIEKDIENYNNSANSDEQEIFLRNILSRLYYTCAHLVLKKHNKHQDIEDRFHEFVIDVLRKHNRALAHKLYLLKKN